MEDMHTTVMEKFSKIMTILKFSKLERNSVSLIMTKKPTMANMLFLTDKWLSWRIMQDTKESGSSTKISVKAKEDKFGQMVPCTKVGGWTTKQMAREDSFTPTVMSMMVNGLMIKLMDSVFTAIWTVQNTRVTGKRINSTDKVSRLGQMVLDMKVNTFKEKNTEKASLLGLTSQHIMANS